MRRTLRARIGWIPIAVSVTAACSVRPVLTQLVDARQAAAALRLHFSQATDAGHLAVMADTDDVAAAAAAEAGAARQQVQQSIDRLHPLLHSLGYQEEQQLLDAFAARFTEFVSLDEEVLPLAVENSNLKAQRLSFGPLRQQAVAFRTAVDAAARRAGDSDWRAQALAARAAAALLEAEVLTAPHIAEAQDAEMTRMESDMKALRDTAAAALEQLRAVRASGRQCRHRRGHCSPGPLSDDGRRDHLAVTPQQRRAVTRVDAWTQASGDGTVRGTAPRPRRCIGETPVRRDALTGGTSVSEAGSSAETRDALNMPAGST